MTDPNFRKRPRYWTQARLFTMAGMIEEGCSDAQIGRHFGKSADAIMLARKRHGIVSRTRAHMTARDVAALLGFGCSKKVAWLIATGRLVGRKQRHSQGPDKAYAISMLAVLDFLENPEHWHLWDWQTITDPALAERMRLLRGHVRFLTYAEVARRFYVQPGTVSNWLARSWIPCRRRGNGNRVIDERDLVGFDPPGIGGNFRQRWYEQREAA